MLISCCKDCPDRRVVDGFNCHTHCKTYKKQRAIRDAEIAARALNQDTTDYQVRTITQIKETTRKNNRR